MSLVVVSHRIFHDCSVVLRRPHPNPPKDFPDPSEKKAAVGEIVSVMPPVLPPELFCFYCKYNNRHSNLYIYLVKMS